METPNFNSFFGHKKLKTTRTVPKPRRTLSRLRVENLPNFQQLPDVHELNKRRLQLHKTSNQRRNQ